MLKNKHILKKIGLGSMVALVGLSLGGCSLGNIGNDYTNHNHSYTLPAKKTLHSSSEIEPITVDFYDASNTQDADNMMKSHIHNYLRSIRNLDDYSISYKPTNVSLDGKNNGDQAETVYVILKHK